MGTGIQPPDLGRALVAVAAIVTFAAFVAGAMLGWRLAL